MQIYIDGDWRTREAATVSVFDHGLLYGDGVFEGIRIYQRRVFRLGAHLDRLYASAHALALAVPLAPEDLAAAVRETVRRNRQVDGYVRLLVTRGVGSLGVDPSSCARPSVIIIVTDIQVYPPDLYASGVRMIIAATRQAPLDVVDPRIKSLNYLKNVLAKIEARNAGAHEAVLLNGAGYVAECTADNLFVVRQGELRTPPTLDGALAGVTRGVIFELAAAAGIVATEAHLSPYDVYTAAESFLTGTGAEVMPVVQLDGRQIGNGKPGPITCRLLAAFHDLTRTEGDPVW